MSLKRKPFIIITILSIILGFWNPLNLLIDQSFLLASVVWIVAIWSTNAMDRNISSIILILLFWIFSALSLVEIVNFAWSSTSLLIMTTSVLSVGISRTGVINKLFRNVVLHYNGSLAILMILPYIFATILVFLIPQAFARVILLGGIMSSIFDDEFLNNSAKKIILFNTFISVVVTSMLFSNGDIVLNQTTLSFAGPQVMQSLDFTGWFRMMGLPTILTIIFLVISILFVFRNELKTYSPEMISRTNTDEEQIDKKASYISIGVMVLVMLAWITEPLHLIPGWIFALVAIIVMLFAGSIQWKDLKAFNPSFILFLTAAFSIGKVMGASGVSDEIFSRLQYFIPSTESAFFLVVITILTIILHMFIGSSVATMSVVLPLFLTLGQSGGYSLEVITLTTYIVVLLQFIFPIHHQTLMIGPALGYYEDRHIVRFGLYLTGGIFVILFLFFVPWWTFTGAM